MIFAITNCELEYKIFRLYYTDFIYLLERGGGKKKEGETTISCLLHVPTWGPGLQQRHVPSLTGIEIATFRFVGDTPPTEPCWSGHKCILLVHINVG